MLCYEYQQILNTVQLFPLVVGPSDLRWSMMLMMDICNVYINKNKNIYWQYTRINCSHFHLQDTSSSDQLRSFSLHLQNQFIFNKTA